MSATALVACSLGGLDGFSSGQVPTSDAGAGDQTPGLDGGDAWAAIAPPDGGASPDILNLVPNPGFEAASDVTCGEPWPQVSYHAEVTTSTQARSGDRACRVCNVGGSTDENFTLDPLEKGFVDVTPGRYEIEAWARVTDPGTELQVAVSLRIYVGEVERAFDSSPWTTVGTSWTRLHAVVDVTRTGKGEVLVISPVRASRPCFLVDDLVLRRLD